MDSKAFRKLFGSIARSHGFESVSGTWFRESAESIVVLELVKSYYGNFYYLEVKIFVQDLAGKKFVVNRDLLKKQPTNLCRRQPPEYQHVLSFDSVTDGVEIDELFRKFVVPFTEEALNKRGLLRLADKNQLFIIPPVRAELQALIMKEREMD